MIRISALALAPVLIATAAQADFTVKAHKTIHVTCTDGICVPHGPNAVLNIADLETMLASSNVTLLTTAASPNILIEGALSVPGSANLTFEARGSVHVDRTVSMAASAGLYVFTNQDHNGGNFLAGKLGSVQFASTSGRLNIEGRPFTLVSSVAALASGIASSPTGNFALASDYDATPDGIYDLAPVGTAFSGRFEGLGNTISSLSVRRGNRGIGLFADIAVGGNVENIVLTKMHIHATGNLRSIGGGLAAVNDGAILNAHVAGKISTTGDDSTEGAYGGALVGVNNGSIALSSASDVPQNGEACVGGLVGLNTGSISQSWAVGKAISDTPGGLVCKNTGTIADSYSLVNVTGRNASPYPGGLVGVNGAGGTVSTSYAAGQVTAVSNFGGAVGANSGGLSNVYWDIEYTGAGAGFGCGSGSCTGATGLEHSTLTSALPSGFAVGTWLQSSLVNNGWPFLAANPPR